MTARMRISLWLLGIAIFLFWSYAMFVAWSSPVFVVFGFVRDASGEPQNGWTVTVKNVTKNWQSEATTGEEGDAGSYQVTRIELMGDSAADAGDVIRVTAVGPNGKTLVETVTLTEEVIGAATLEVDFGSDASPPPTLTALDPTTVLETGGESITLTGTGLVDGATLVLRRTDGGIPAEIELPLTVNDETTATAVLPALSVGTWTVELTNPDNQSASLENALTVNEVIREDLTGDGAIDIADLVLVARDFGAAGAGLRGDVNGDGIVNLVDLVMVAKRFGETVGAAPSIQPSPAGTVLATATPSLSDDKVSLVLRVSDFDGNLSELAAYDAEIAFDPAVWRVVHVGGGTLLGSTDRTFRHVSTPSGPKAGRLRLIAVALDDVPAAGDELAGITLERMAPRGAAPNLRIVRVTVADRSARVFRLATTQVDWNLRLTTVPRTIVGQNYPNPFNPETWIPYQLAETVPVSVWIYNASGSLVRTLDLGVQRPGEYVMPDRAAYWDGRNAQGEQVASGLYFYEFRAGAYVSSGRMFILK